MSFYIYTYTFVYNNNLLFEIETNHQMRIHTNIQRFHKNFPINNDFTMNQNRNSRSVRDNNHNADNITMLDICAFMCSAGIFFFKKKSLNLNLFKNNNQIISILCYYIVFVYFFFFPHYYYYYFFV